MKLQKRLGKLSDEAQLYPEGFPLLPFGTILARCPGVTV